MTEDRVSAEELSVLRRLWLSDDAGVNQRDVGAALARRILASPAAIVVLYGPQRSGKSELMRLWVEPVVKASATLVHRTLRDGFDSRVAPDDTGMTVVEVWDHIDEPLLDEAERAHLVEHLKALSLDTGSKRKAILVLDDAQLGELFALRSAVPALLDAVIEVPVVSPLSFVEELNGVVATMGVTLSTDVLTSVVDDLELARSQAPLESRLLVLVAFELWRAAQHKPLGKQDYLDSGGLHGILERFLDFLCDRLPDQADPQLGWAILDDVVHKRTLAGHLHELANRFDASPQLPQKVLDWLVEQRALVVAPTGGYDLVTEHLLTGIQARRHRTEEIANVARWVLRQGAQQFKQCDTLLSEVAFLKVHAQRKALMVDADEARLMVRCALVYDEPGARTTQHWLKRIGDVHTRAEVLLEGSFDARPDVRERSVRLMGDLPEPEIKSRLHMLALRDTVESVSAAAAESLSRVVADDDLIKHALRQEIESPSSPYRLQAIDALRMLRDTESVATLAKLVLGNQPGEDGEARAKAIIVLGAHDTLESARALVEVALRDRDLEDREGATKALANTRRPDVMGAVLELLRAQRGSQRPPGRRDLKSVAKAAGAVLGALFVTLCTFVLHGLLLLSLRQWRPALVVTAVEAGALLLPDWAEFFVLLTTFVAGLIVPARSLWLERGKGVFASASAQRPTSVAAQPHGAESEQSFEHSYRDAVGWTLFSITTFLSALLPHGLMSMLVKRIGRGVYCFVMETVGFALMLSGGFWKDQLEAYQALTPMFTLIPGVLMGVGALLFFASWFLDVGTVLWSVFLRRETRRTAERIDDIESQLTCNELAASYLLQALEGADRHSRQRWAIRLLRRHEPGQPFRRLILQLLQQSSTRVRQRIVTVLGARRDTTSLEVLRDLDETRSFLGRMRYRRAKVGVGLKLLPPGMLGLVSVVGGASLAIVFLLLQQYAHQPDHLQQAIVHPSSGWSGTTWLLGTPKESSGKLVRLATQTKDDALGQAALTQLATVLRSEAVEQNVKLAILQALAKEPGGIAARTQSQATFEHSLVLLLRDSTVSRDALRALAAIDTTSVVHELIDMVNGLPRSQTDAVLNAAIESAIKRLGTMQSDDVARMSALDRWTRDVGIPDYIHDIARRAFEQSPSLAKAAFYFDRAVSKAPESEADLDVAIAFANAAIQDGDCTYACSSRAKNTLAHALSRRGLLAIAQASEQGYALAEHELSAAFEAIHGIEPQPECVDDLFTLGLNVGFHKHEYLALRDPTQYEKYHELVLQLQPLSKHFSPEWQVTIDANLAESDVTTGRYTDALAATRELPKRAHDLQVNVPDLDLNMKFLELTVAVLSNDAATAATTEQAMWKLNEERTATTPNAWSYAGLINYVRHAKLPAADKARVEAAMLGITQKSSSGSKE